ncbi:DUF4245 domain-containing protein [Modestobacter caceresii]|uniref:DUF4245 domain-containing protein n=1 Tax=Modestobacter caceresii TaxID=1522368 RepID=UPI0009DF87F6|nr:DUF4245 domain-containing protein [Modestobacter caceresii]
MPDTGQDGEQPRPAQPSVTATDAATGTSPDAGGPAPAASPAEDRMHRFTSANMIRSLLPLLVICLVIVGVTALRQNPTDPVRDVDPASAQRAAAERADYELLVPTDLPDGWRSTSVRTNAGSVQAGAPVTLEIGWFTPSEEYAGYVVSDDPSAPALADVLDGATADGTEQVDGQSWERLDTQRGETALTRTADGATLVVSGSASEEELATLAGSLEPYAP